MKALLQRVSRAKVDVGGCTAGSIGRGLVVLLGIRTGDSGSDASYLARKTLGLRIFSDSDGRMNLSVRDINGGILVISQFTLYADTGKGNRPSFIQAADPHSAENLYRSYVAALKREIGENRISTGRFGAMMAVEMVNDGPVTVELVSARG